MGCFWQIDVAGLLDRRSVLRSIGLPGVRVQHVPGEFTLPGEAMTIVSVAPARRPERRPLHLRRVGGRFIDLTRPWVPRARRARTPRLSRRRSSQRARTPSTTGDSDEPAPPLGRIQRIRGVAA